MAGISPSSLAKSRFIRPPETPLRSKKNPLGVCRASGSMRAFKFRLLKPPRARLAAVMMVMMMMPAQIHDQQTLTKTPSVVKGVPSSTGIANGDRHDPLFLIVFLQAQGRGVDAETQTRGLRTIREDVPQMRFAAAAHDFRAHHSVGFIGLERYFRFVHGRRKAWPPGAGIILRLRFEQRFAAADAVEYAVFLGVPVFSRERRLSALLASHAILFVGKLLAPFRV